jgi:hypothetical protein
MTILRLDSLAYTPFRNPRDLFALYLHHYNRIIITTYLELIDPATGAAPRYNEVLKYQ